MSNEWTKSNIARARLAVDVLLREAELDAYLFGVEPREDRWNVRLECATDEGWKVTQLTVDQHVLLDCVDDVALRRRILDAWAPRLSRCKRSQREP